MKKFKLALIVVFTIIANIAFAQAKPDNKDIKNLYQALAAENNLQANLTKIVQTHNSTDANILFSNIDTLTNLRINSIKSILKFYKITQPKTGKSYRSKIGNEISLEADYKYLLDFLQKNFKFYEDAAFATKNSGVKSMFNRIKNLTNENIKKLTNNWQTYSKKNLPKTNPNEE